MDLGLLIGICQFWSQGLVVNYLESYSMTQKRVCVCAHTNTQPDFIFIFQQLFSS